MITSVDAVSRYRDASPRKDIDEMVSTLAPDAELVSPLSGRMVFRGRDDLRILLGAVYNTLRGLRWDSEFGDERERVLVGSCRIGPFKIGDAMVLELADDGQIQRIRPHLRPWLGLTVFALVIGPKLAAHPDVIWRALRG